MKRVVIVIASVLLCLSVSAWADSIVINGGTYQNYWDNPTNAGYLNNGGRRYR